MTRTMPDLFLAALQVAVARDFLSRIIVPDRDRTAIEAIEHCLDYVERDINERSLAKEPPSEA